jgi:hypothetical protein
MEWWKMSETVSPANARCTEGWRLFWLIGDLFSLEVQKEPYKRNWEDWQAAVDEHKDHIKKCDTCHFGIKTVQIKLEEMAAERN